TRIWALNRIEFLRKTAAPLTPATGQPAPANYGQPTATYPAIPAYPYGPTVTAPPLAPGRAPSQYTYDREKPAGQDPLARPPPMPRSVEQWTDLGELRKSYLQIDGGTKVYAMEMNNPQRMLYVTAYPGLNLEQYLNRKVLLFGPILYSGALRNYYMSVT